MNRNMRVAMLGAYPVDTTRISGGVQAAYTYLVKGLTHIHNLELHILTFRPPEFTGPDEVQHDNLSIHLLSLYPRFERMRNYRNFQSMIDKELAQIQPDLIHVQDVAAEAYVAIRSGYPTVMTIHGIRREDRKYFTSWKQKLRHYFDNAFIEKYTLAHAHHLIAISRYVTQYYRSMIRPGAEIHFIPNAIDDLFFNLPGTTGGATVLFAGRVIPLKRVLDLVKAFALVVKQVPTAQLRIAGEMTSEKAYVTSICEWIRQTNLNDHIHLLGPLPESLIFQEFATCNLLALPSAQESAPMVIAQAMAAGKPVVATRVGGVGEMVGEDGQRGYMVEVGDIEGLAGAIICLLQDPGLQQRMGQKGRAFARENYHIQSVARQTTEIYQEILLKEQGINV